MTLNYLSAGMKHTPLNAIIGNNIINGVTWICCTQNNQNISHK